MYLVFISESFSPKNKLESEFSEYLKELNRLEISESHVEEFIAKILSNYKKMCEKHNRCKPVRKEISKGYRFEGDLTLFGASCSFSLLKSKNKV